MTNSESLAGRIRAVSLLNGTFTLRSGQRSNQYFDKYRFEADPGLLRDIGSAMQPLVPSNTRVLAGLEMGGIPLVTVLSQLTGLPCAFIRKEAKAYGTCRYAEGADLPSKGTVLIEDVVSTGGALLDAIKKLHADNVFSDTAICVIDRESSGSEALAECGVELRALFTMRGVLAE